MSAFMKMKTEMIHTNLSWKAKIVSKMLGK